MADVTEVYVFLQEHCANTCVECGLLYNQFLIENRFNPGREVPCIAVPALSGSALEWKSPAQCVWDDDEFSQNELVLESKTAIRGIVEQHAPKARTFFTDVLNLQDAGIGELLADLKLMQTEKRDDPQRVHRIYERIESCRRKWPKTIMYASARRLY